MPTIFGSAIKRREDARLVTGAATYTDDVKLPGLTYAAILRSRYAHARISAMDVEAARQAPGVLAVYTDRDVQAKTVPVPCAAAFDYLRAASLRVALTAMAAGDRTKVLDGGHTA